MEEKYKVVDGTSFHKDTPMAVCQILNDAMKNRSQKIRIFYGDTETGRDWNEAYDIFGYIGRSMGPVKIPLMIYSHRSGGGPGILDHCIVRITIDKRNVYRHPKYYCPIEQKGNEIYNGEGRCILRGKDERTASRWMQFFLGERNAH